ncbi:MAG: OmpA family protein, partial [Leadbetterella sp.]
MDCLIKYFFTILILVGFQPILAHSQEKEEELDEDIPLQIVLQNAKNGNLIKKDFDISVIDIEKKKKIDSKIIKNRNIYSLLSNKNYKVQVNAAGYYSEEIEIDKNQIGPEGEYVIKLDAASSNSILIKVIDAETKEGLQSAINITHESKVISGSTTASNPSYAYMYDKIGSCKLKISSPSYIDDTRSFELQKNDFNKEIVIELRKSKSKIEYSIVSKITNLPIPEGKISFTQKDKGIKAYEGKFSDGKFLFDGKIGEIYTVLISAEGFASYSENVKLEEKVSVFKLVSKTSYYISIFDDKNKNRLEGDITIKSPSNKISKIKSSKVADIMFSPTELGEYSIETNLPGYINKQETFRVIESKIDKVELPIYLVAGTNEYVLSVFDIDTKLPINNAVVRVFSDRNTEVKGKNTKNTHTYKLDIQKNYFLEATAEEYADYTENIKDNKSIDVYLRKLKRDTTYTYLLTVLDQQTLLPVPNATVLIKENKQKNLEVFFEPSKNQFSVSSIDLKSAYEFEAFGKSYTSISGKLNLEKHSDTIYLKPSDLMEFKFQAKDAFFDELIKADMQITKDNVKIPTKKNSLFIEASLSTNQFYGIEIIHPEYHIVKRNIDLGDAVNGLIKYDLYKKTYSVLYKIEPLVGEEKLRTLEFKLKNNTTENVETLEYSSGKKGFTGLIYPEYTYTITVKLVGYEDLTSEFDIKKLDTKSLVRVLRLNPLKSEPVAKIVDPPKPIPSSEMQIAFNKHFPLEGVQFARSKTTFTSGSEQKLQVLVDFLKANPNAKIQIIGHTDNDGSDQRLNQNLSEFRAKV